MFQKCGNKCYKQLVWICFLSVLMLVGCSNVEPVETIDVQVQMNRSAVSDRNYTIDREMDEQLSETVSNIECIEILIVSRDRWIVLMQEYYDELLSSNRTDIAEAVAKSQADWEAYYQIAYANEEQLSAAIYGAGSTGGLAIARFDYEIYRTRALELYMLCCQSALSEKVTAP